jgi:hypothetical protein
MAQKRRGGKIKKRLAVGISHVSNKHGYWIPLTFENTIPFAEACQNDEDE